VAPKKKTAEECKEPIDRLTYVLWQAQHATERKLLASLADMNLHMVHFGLLRHLSQAAGLTGAEIARRLDVTPQTVSSALANLKVRGLVRGTAHPVHRGLVELELTDAGKKALAEAYPRVNAVENEMLAVMSKKEREVLLDLLIRIRKVLRRDTPV
jgi:DNA-binding MarR family transcriptional regulator